MQHLGRLVEPTHTVKFGSNGFFFRVKPFLSCFLTRVQSSKEALLSPPLISKNECLTLQKNPVMTKPKMTSRQKLIKTFSWTHRAYTTTHTFVMLSFFILKLSFSREPVFYNSSWFMAHFFLHSLHLLRGIETSIILLLFQMQTCQRLQGNTKSFDHSY